MMWWRPLAALVAAASATALLAPTASAADPEAADPPDASVGAFAPLPSVRFIYAVPTDREFSPVFESVVARSALHFQGWLLDRTGGTFVIRHGPLPQRCRMPGEHDHYLRGGAHDPRVQGGHMGQRHGGRARLRAGRLG